MGQRWEWGATSKGILAATRSGRRQRFSSRASAGTTAAGLLDFCPMRLMLNLILNYERIHFYRLKPPKLWWFVTVATGYYHRDRKKKLFRLLLLEQSGKASGSLPRRMVSEHKIKYTRSCRKPSIPIYSCCSVTKSCLILCGPMDWSTPGFPIPQYLPEFAQTSVHWVDDAIWPSPPLLPLLLLPSVLPSIKVFSSESALRIRWPKYWSFSFIISPSNEYSGLISLKDWLKSLLQHHSSKASVLQCSAFFVAQASHPFMTTGIPNHSFGRMDLGQQSDVSAF